MPTMLLFRPLKTFWKLHLNDKRVFHLTAGNVETSVWRRWRKEDSIHWGSLVHYKPLAWTSFHTRVQCVSSNTNV